ncbi:outer membrane beta-barrel protein [Flavobacterium sp. TP390]|uniref:Outer membrane beta-barrel protein n=1 Tax=Flavobacterium profundi TaxID=1774945 RepID=A0A6I4IF81_9FLAO|nr:outer membrane beta-barrel protein [Flavobacterium profundi]MVO08140.1 outer membrane beta-barrel protein [Flavobacterium profundi]
MKKIKALFVLFLLCQSITAQELSYGPMIGFTGYDVNINGPINGGAGFSGLNFGGFIDYQLNASFGVRGSINYSVVKEDNYGAIVDRTWNNLFEEAKIQLLQFNGLVRFDVNKSYNKGFYLTSGLKLSNALNVKIDGDKNDDFYAKTYLNFMFGLGVMLNKDISFEFIPEINVSNTLDYLSEQNTSKNYGATLNITCNLDPIFRK